MSPVPPCNTKTMNWKILIHSAGLKGTAELGDHPRYNVTIIVVSRLLLLKTKFRLGIIEGSSQIHLSCSHTAAPTGLLAILPLLLTLPLIFQPISTLLSLWYLGLHHRLSVNSISLFSQTWSYCAAPPQSLAGLTPWSLANGGPVVCCSSHRTEHTKGHDPNCRGFRP